MDKELDKTLHQKLDMKHKTLEDSLNKKLSLLDEWLANLDNDLRKLFKV